MRSSWFPLAGAALFAGALHCLSGCNAAESLVSSSKVAASNAVASTAHQRTLMFEERALEVGEKAEDWRASAGVHVGRFASKKRHGVSFEAVSGGRVRARTAALPGTFGRATKAKVRLSVRDASAQRPVTVRFEFFDAAGAVRWSEPVTFTDARWKIVTLRFPRAHDPARALLSPMRDVSSWGMSFETGSEVQVQDFELWRLGAPELPTLAQDFLGFIAAEPASLRASRTITGSWMRGETEVGVAGMFDGVVSLHRQMARRFPGAPDPDAETPITVSVMGGMQTMWSLAESAMGNTESADEPGAQAPSPLLQRPPLPLPWLSAM